MKSTTANKVYLSVIAVMGIVIFVLLQRKPCESQKMVKVITIETKMSRPKLFAPINPTPKRLKSPSRNDIASVIDTSQESEPCIAMAKDYLTERIYADTLRDDTAEVYVATHVHRNAITRQYLAYKILTPFVSTTNVYENPRRVQVYAAGNLGTDLQGFIAGPQIIVKDRRDLIYTVSGNFNTSGNHSVMAGIGFKISFRKNYSN